MDTLAHPIVPVWRRRSSTSKAAFRTRRAVVAHVELRCFIDVSAGSSSQRHAAASNS
jgi:hypothetical protein